MAGIQAKAAFGKLDEGTKKVDPFFITGQPIGSNRYALDAISMMAYEVSAANTAGAGSTTQIINKVAHGAKVRDIVVFQSGTQNEFEVHVLNIIDNDNFERFNIFYNLAVKRFRIFERKKWESFIKDIGAKEIIGLIKSHFMDGS